MASPASPTPDWDIVSARRPGFSPELRALCCILTPVRAQGEAALRQLVAREKIDWQAVHKLAVRHRVHPVLYSSLSASPLKQHFPEDSFRKLTAGFQRNITAALQNTEELGKLAALFASHDIPVLTFKGLALARDVYGSITARHAGDLDLLLPFDAVTAAHELLLQSGYTLLSSDRPITPRQFKSFSRLREELEYKNAGTGVRVELHWRLLFVPEFYPISFTELYERAEDFEVSGQTLHKLGPTDTHLYLFAHGAVHAWFRLKWLLDVAHVLHQMDAAGCVQLLANAQQFGLLRPVLQGVTLVHRLFLVPVPPDLHHLQTLATGRPLRWLVARAEKAIQFEGILCAQTGGDLFRKNLYLSLLKKQLTYKLSAILRRHFTNPNDWRLLKLPDRFFPLYYLLRPVFLLISIFHRGYFYRGVTDGKS